MGTSDPAALRAIQAARQNPATMLAQVLDETRRTATATQAIADELGVTIPQEETP